MACARLFPAMATCIAAWTTAASKPPQGSPPMRRVRLAVGRCYRARPPWTHCVVTLAIALAATACSVVASTTRSWSRPIARRAPSRSSVRGATTQTPPTPLTYSHNYKQVLWWIKSVIHRSALRYILCYQYGCVSSTFSSAERPRNQRFIHLFEFVTNYASAVAVARLLSMYVSSFDSACTVVYLQQVYNSAREAY